MNAEPGVLGKLSLVGDTELASSRAKLKKILALGSVNKFEVARTISAVTEVVRRTLQDAKTTIELELSLSPDESACLIFITVWHGKQDDEPFLSRYFEVSQDRQRLEFSRWIPLSVVDVNFRHQASEIMDEKSDEEIRQLILDKEAAEAANLVQLNFIRKVSHELRTPLNVIKGYGEILMEQAEEPQAREDLTHILEAGEQLLNIIDNVLDFSKSEMGEVEIVEESLSIEALVHELVDELTSQIERKGNTFDVVCSEALPPVTTDKGKLNYILGHLLTNASKFTKDGEISLRVSEERKSDAEGILFLVEDTGQGIGKMQLVDLFRPFAQTESVGSGVGGLGIGLALCQRYTKMLGGSLGAESTPGEGTVFRLWIPLVADTPSSSNVFPGSD